MKKFKSKAFTLAEIMIVLTVVGILTAILLPAAFHTAPDENVMKFKKANSTLGTVIRELVNSDEYYAGGDLGKKADGSTVFQTDYLCKTMAEVLNIKSINCSSYKNFNTSHICTDWTEFRSMDIRKHLDDQCRSAANNVGAEIITHDNITYYQGSGGVPFGTDKIPESFSGENGTFSNETPLDIELFYVLDTDGFYRCYKTICIDVDGIGKGEAPFGYGIRIDGKIFPGARATEWINKSVQNEN